MSKKFSTTELVKQIEKLTKQRIAEGEVVELNKFRQVQNAIHPTTILVIEDDEAQQNSLKRMLQLDQYQVKLAANSGELAKVLDEELELHCIIMDVGLPWVNGFELAEILKSNKLTQHIPLIFLSGSAEDNDLQKARTLGADDYIKKPFDIEKLRSRIRELLIKNK